MSIQKEILTAPVVPLRYLVSFNPRPTSDSDGDTVYLPMEAISEFGPLDTLRRRPFSDLRQGYSYVANGDIALAKVTPCFENGKGFVARTLPGGHAFATSEVIVMRPSPAVEPDYLGWVFQSSPFMRQGESHMTGAGGLRRVPDSFVGSYAIPVPDPRAQQAIANFLDHETARIDTLIEEQQRLIEMLGERRAALIAQETGWGASRPNHWPMMRLSWLFRSTGSGTTPANEDIIYGNDAEVPWVTTGELREAIVLETERGISSDVVERYSALKIHPAGSLLIAMYGATIGRMALLGIPATSNQACCALIGPTRADPEFVQYSLMAAKNWLLLEAAGGGQPNINQDKIRSFRIPAPVLEEQRHIAAYLNEKTANIEKIIVEAKLFIELSRERRSALITAAVTGQIDVREMV